MRNAGVFSVDFKTAYFVSFKSGRNKELFDNYTENMPCLKTFNDRSNRREHLVLFGAGSIDKRVRNFAILIRLFDDFKLASIHTNMAEGQEKDISETTTTM